MSRFLCDSAVFVMAALLSSGAAAQPSGNAIVARTGDTVPGAANTFTTFKAPSLNDAGEAAFVAYNNASIIGKDGIYRGSTLPGTLVEVAREGSPGTDGSLVIPESGWTPAL